MVLPETDGTLLRDTLWGVRIPADLDQKILDYLRQEDWPVTTEMVAQRLRVSCNTAQIHLYKLIADGKVKGKRVGRQDQWALK